MEKKLHLISNAHLDPVWQWEWEEGACAAISTFRCAASFCREFDGYIFCHNEALLYRWIEEYEPTLFEEIRELVKSGKWHIMGGWHLQPDCNMPSGESFVRQILSGREYFKEKFGINSLPTTAINFDPFGHTRGLVQILAKSGYDSYLFCRPSEQWCHLEADDFTWVGYDGSRVMARRAGEGYNSPLGHATDKIREMMKRVDEEHPLGYCLWGVGDHGGGPSRKDLADIEQLIAEAAKEGVQIVHSTPEGYFHDLKASGKKLPEHAADLNSWAPGCYTSQVRIKQKHREVEALLYSCEKMCTALSMQTDFVYPEREIGEALYDLLTAEFHDSLPGSSVQPVEDMALRMLDHAKEILTRVRMRAFLRLCDGQKVAKEGEIPVLVYNPHPYPVEEDITCEFMLADQNWSNTFTLPTVYQSNGERIPSQCEKENSNLPLDWRKRVTFHATLAPMAINRFDCRMVTLPEKPALPKCSDESMFRYETEHMLVEINRKTGLIDRLCVDGVEMIRPGAFSLDVMADVVDPWAMTRQHWRDKIGQFTLLSAEEGTRFSNVEALIPSVRIIEDGEVRTVVEAVFGYDASRAVVQYKLSKSDARIDVDIRLVNCEKAKMIKWNIPLAKEKVTPIMEVAFGEEPMRDGGFECVGQKYLRVAESPMVILNRGTYGASFDGGSIKMTLLRSAAYTAHPIGDRKILPQDRHSPYMEQGERLFSFRLLFGKNATHDIARQGWTFHEQPMAVSFFPSGLGDSAAGSNPAIRLVGDEIVMSACKRAENGQGFIVRLFNPKDTSTQGELVLETLGIHYRVTLGKYEVATFRLTDAACTPCNLMEDAEE